MFSPYRFHEVFVRLAGKLEYLKASHAAFLGSYDCYVGYLTPLPTVA